MINIFKKSVLNTSSSFSWIEKLNDIIKVLKNDGYVRIDTIQPRPVELKKVLAELRVYQKILARLVNWLRKSFSWNLLKCPEILNRVVIGNTDN